MRRHDEGDALGELTGYGTHDAARPTGRPVPVTVLDLGREEGERAVEMWPTDDGYLVDASDLDALTGWHLTAGGLCRGDACVPLPAGARPDGPSTNVALSTVANLLGLPLVVDVDARLVVVGVPPAERMASLAEMRTPPFTLPRSDGGTLCADDLRGRKTLLVAWASWCGCRYDLPRWQEVHDELSPHGFGVVGVAVDEDVDAVRPWVDDVGVRFPVVVDRDHRLVEAFAMTHVPTVVWLDEDGAVVRPNTVAFADDTFTSVHGVRSAPHLDALRRWVVDGDAGIGCDEAARRAPAPSFDAQLARAEFAAAVTLLRRGDDAAAAGHFDAAERLAPDDFTIRRGSMPLRGRNPFGPEFFAWYEEWRARGEPGYDHMD